MTRGVDPTGSFVLDGLSGRRYRLQVWSPDGGTPIDFGAPVFVGAGADAGRAVARARATGGDRVRLVRVGRRRQLRPPLVRHIEVAGVAPARWEPVLQPAR